MGTGFYPLHKLHGILDITLILCKFVQFDWIPTKQHELEKTSNDRITLLHKSPIFARKVEPLEKQEAIEALQIQYTHFYHMFMKALCTIPIPLPSHMYDMYHAMKSACTCVFWTNTSVSHKLVHLFPCRSANSQQSGNCCTIKSCEGTVL